MNNSSLFADLLGVEPAYRRHTKLVGNLIWGLASLVGVPLNLAVLVVIVKCPDMRTISNTFIFNLALADLLFLLGTPIVIVQSIQGSWIFGDSMCKLFLSGNGVNQFARAVFIGVLSFDRYLAICHPHKAVKWRTQHLALLQSIVAWMIVILEMVPLLKFSHMIHMPMSDITTCMSFWGSDDMLETLDNDDKEFLKDTQRTFAILQLSRRLFTIYSFCLSYLLPLVCIWFFYSNIIVSLWMSKRRLFGGRSSNRTTAKVTVMGLAVVISYTLCWLPFWTVQWSIEIDAAWTVHHHVLMPVMYGAYALQYINSALDPFLYVFLTDIFRQNVCVAHRNRLTADERARSPYLPELSRMRDESNNSHNQFFEPLELRIKARQSSRSRSRSQKLSTSRMSQKQSLLLVNDLEVAAHDNTRSSFTSCNEIHSPR